MERSQQAMGKVGMVAQKGEGWKHKRVLEEPPQPALLRGARGGDGPAPPHTQGGTDPARNKALVTMVINIALQTQSCATRWL